ncbi:MULTISPECIES: amino acid adenylation domain-containing protein [unclassified Bradyrhizobium]|uniref:amino acid adenylation domain-containing protein n=1 Tax=unclassified Bradyrhizobium TaxID=2631580 RepID=UPI0028EDB35F|nr:MULTISPECIES: amino acid adenylation domain-containing protein [unclassified Bradyrhizobium]
MEDLPLGKSDTGGPDRPSRVDHLFRDIARRHATQIALSWNGGRLTYAELDQLSDRLSMKLITAGAKEGEYIAVSLERREQAVLAMLAILKSGAAYVSLDPRDDHDQAARLSEIAGVRRVIRKSDRQDISDLSVEHFNCEGTRVDTAIDPHEHELSKVDPIACLMLTSGTTAGRKAVMVPHRGVVRLVVGQDYAELGPTAVMLQLAPLTFDASTFEIWGALLTGGRLVAYPRSAVDAGFMHKLIESEKINTLWLTAGLFHTLARHRADQFRDLRTLVTGGDVVRPDFVEKVFEACPNLKIVNGYGPTENTTFTCCHVMSAGERLGHSVPIGRPIVGTTVFVLDTNMHAVAPGEDGELYCGGLGVARGYLGEPELTAQRFVAAPWNAQETLYRTGDRVRALNDGTLIFLGRYDDQAKVRGYRVVLGEIERVLRSMDGIEEAVVELVRNDSGNRLIAHVQPRGPAVFDASGIREFARARLPHYAVPDVFKMVNALELTQTGKLKRKYDAATS